MRPKTHRLFLLSCVLIAGCTRPPAGGEQAAAEEKRKALAGIRAYRDKPLQHLEPEQSRELLGHLGKLGVEVDGNDLASFGPWFVWDFGKKDRPAFVLLLEARKKFPLPGNGGQVAWVHRHPGATPVTLTLIDDSGGSVAETELSTGWRCYLRDAGLWTAGENDDPLVILETELGGGPGPDIKRQYYARIGNCFDLVRLENAAARATRNRYYVNHFRSGPRVAELTEEEWETDLLSAERARVLRALTWLGGLHWDLRTEHGEDTQQYEDANQVELWRKVKAREKVVARVRELVKSDDAWLREAAELAADPQDDHF